MLEDKGQNGWTQGWVFLKFLQVAAVFASRPHSHLYKADDCEEGDRKALSHHGEAQPGACLREENTTTQRTVSFMERNMYNIWNAPLLWVHVKCSAHMTICLKKTTHLSVFTKKKVWICILVNWWKKGAAQWNSGYQNLKGGGLGKLRHHCGWITKTEKYIIYNKTSLLRNYTINTVRFEKKNTHGNVFIHLLTFIFFQKPTNVV